MTDSFARLSQEFELPDGERIRLLSLLVLAIVLKSMSRFDSFIVSEHWNISHLCSGSRYRILVPVVMRLWDSLFADPDRFSYLVICIWFCSNVIGNGNYRPQRYFCCAMVTTLVWLRCCSLFTHFSIDSNENDDSAMNCLTTTLRTTWNYCKNIRQ